MPRFTSKREKSLWVWTIVIVVAIYATLGLASIVAEALRAQGMNDDIAAAGFLFGMFLVGLAVLTQGLKKRPAGVEIAVALGVAAVYFMLFLRMALAERSHLFEYSVVAIFIYEALRERKKQGGHVPVPGLLAILFASMIGTIDECIQLFLPSRVFDPADILFNLLAATLAVGSSAALSWARRLRKK